VPQGAIEIVCGLVATVKTGAIFGPFMGLSAAFFVPKTARSEDDTMH
jgi:hypothetical protein